MSVILRTVWINLNFELSSFEQSGTHLYLRTIPMGLTMRWRGILVVLCCKRSQPETPNHRFWILFLVWQDHILEPLLVLFPFGQTLHDSVRSWIFPLEYLFSNTNEFSLKVNTEIAIFLRKISHKWKILGRFFWGKNISLCGRRATGSKRANVLSWLFCKAENCSCACLTNRSLHSRAEGLLGTATLGSEKTF